MPFDRGVQLSEVEFKIQKKGFDRVVSPVSRMSSPSAKDRRQR